jgi:hypothetical protein
MAPREKVATRRLAICMLALAVYGIFTWAARDGRLHGHEWLISLGLWAVAIPIFATIGKVDPQDERDVLIGLRATRLALAALLLALFALCAVFGFGRGMWAPVPSGMLVCAVLVALAVLEGARLYYYRRGV